jgi:membrane-bound serine protease (ClpP class)
MLLGALLAVLTPAAALAQKTLDRGYVLKIPAALDTGWIKAHKRFINHRLARFEEEDKGGGGRFKLICDFNPDNRPSACDDFYACDSLADYLLELKNRGVLTVAYVHDEVTRHSVLPVLACAEIVFADVGPPERPRAPGLGRVSSLDKPLSDKERGAYERIVAGRWSSAIIQKMYDANLVVVEMEAGVPGEHFRDKKSARGGSEIPELGRGTLALYTFKDAQKYGLCQKKPLNTLNDVLSNYGLSSTTRLYDAPEQTIAVCVSIKGELDGGLFETTKRHIRGALGQKANLLILQLECHGGDGYAARQLAQFLLDQKKERSEPFHIIAYVTPQANDTAAFLVFASDEIVFRGDAILSFEKYIKMQPKLERTLREGLVQVAKQGVHPYLLAEGMLNRELRIYRVASVNGDGRQMFMSETDFLQDQADKNPQWKSVELVKPIGVQPEDQDRYLTLTADSARKLGLAADDGVVSSYEDLCGKYGLDPAQVKLEENDWLDKFGELLRHWATSMILVMVGITCLILELKMPGVSLPGVIAAICFVLFFWAHAGFNQIGVLAILLFALGLLLVLLEVFVLPGFGVPGIAGILLMLGSLGLVAYGHWPRSNGEWYGFGKSLSPFGISVLGAVVSAYFLAKYLPNIPYANRLFLKPPSLETEEGELQLVDHPLRAELVGLLGAIGVAATPLRPAGKVQFGDQFVDVVAESGYVQPGTRVQVVEIEGNRVVVKEV